MDEEQITNRYVRGWISLEDFKAEMVRFYDREDKKEREKWHAPSYSRMTDRRPVKSHG